MQDQEEAVKAFEVTCDDGTQGRIGSKSSEKAKELAQEMCEVHGGVTGEVKPRS